MKFQHAIVLMLLLVPVLAQSFVAKPIISGPALVINTSQQISYGDYQVKLVGIDTLSQTKAAFEVTHEGSAENVILSLGQTKASFNGLFVIKLTNITGNSTSVILSSFDQYGQNTTKTYGNFSITCNGVDTRTYDKLLFTVSDGNSTESFVIRVDEIKSIWFGMINFKLISISLIPACGDGACNGDEDQNTCPQDCTSKTSTGILTMRSTATEVYDETGTRVTKDIVDIRFLNPDGTQTDTFTVSTQDNTDATGTQTTTTSNIRLYFKNNNQIHVNYLNNNWNWQETNYTNISNKILTTLTQGETQIHIKYQPTSTTEGYITLEVINPTIGTTTEKILRKLEQKGTYTDSVQLDEDIFGQSLLYQIGTTTTNLSNTTETFQTQAGLTIETPISEVEARGLTVKIPAQPQEPTPVCGDNTCNGNETQTTCPQDCGCPAGTHLEGTTCVADPTCGDDTCNGEETKQNCPMDCGCPDISQTYTCTGSCSGNTYYTPAASTCTATATPVWNGTACVGSTQNCCTFTTEDCSKKTCPTTACKRNAVSIYEAKCTTSGCSCIEKLGEDCSKKKCQNPTCKGNVPTRYEPTCSLGACSCTERQGTPCKAGTICRDGACVNPPKKPNGAACLSNSDCQSNFCQRFWWLGWRPGVCKNIPVLRANGLALRR